MAQSRRGQRRRSGPEAGDGIVVNGYSEQWLRKGFPWVYREEVVARTGSLVPGRTVRIRARNGDTLGTGIWDEGKVEVRRFRSDDGPVDVALLRDRVVAARARRPLPADTTAYRLVHGENDEMPGIRVDVWGGAASIVLDSPSLARLIDPLSGVLQQELGISEVFVHGRPPDADRPADWSRVPLGQIAGRRPESDVVVQERGVRVAVRPWDGADTGLYNDMRDVRAWMEPHWAGKRVLNTFAYTGMFSVAAAHHGAAAVTTVDLSPHYLERARANFVLNDLDPSGYDWVVDDTFKALDTLRRKQAQYDVVVADPPSFSHSDAGTWSVATGLGRLVSSCLRVLAPGGWLIVATNLGSMSPKEFRKLVLKGSHKAKRPLRLVHEGSTPVDFPAALDFPESRYLKCWILQA